MTSIQVVFNKQNKNNRSVSSFSCIRNENVDNYLVLLQESLISLKEQSEEITNWGSCLQICGSTKQTSKIFFSTALQ